MPKKRRGTRGTGLCSRNLGAAELGILLTLSGDNRGIPTKETQVAVLEVLEGIKCGKITVVSYDAKDLAELHRRATMPIESLRREIESRRQRAKRNPGSRSGGLLVPRWNAPTGPCSHRTDRIPSGRNTHSRPLGTDDL
ncbi:hypothetical protein L6258_02430 [Candidatus Parcubacteria bacterium]|nr:hypothetical protein [Candidatus Parcubacteria bacterium]